jgi:hypothetical protein
MAAFSDYLEGVVLGVTLLGSAYTPPSTVYMALATSCTTDGAVFEEVPTGTAYARQVVVFGAPVVTGLKKQVTNDGAVTFPEATTPWGTITHCGLYDSPTGGNQLYFGALTAVRTISTADTFQFNDGDFATQVG